MALTDAHYSQTPGWSGRLSFRTPTAILWVCIFAWSAFAVLLSMALPIEAKVDAGLWDKISDYVGHTLLSTIVASYLLVMCIAVRRLMSGQAIDAKSLRPAEIFQDVIHATLAFFAIMFAYTTIKVRITQLVPFRWDQTFMEWDRALLGQDAWRLLDWAYGFPELMEWIALLYAFWIGIFAAAFTACFVMRQKLGPSAMRFPLAVIFTWCVGGNLIAMIFSSGGPIYYGSIVEGTNVFAAQLDALASLDGPNVSSAVMYSDMLWDIHSGNALGFGGISAMPSMHCATAFLIALLVWPLKRWRWLAVGYTLVIWATSVLLAWHYWIDGLFALPIALLAWWLARWVIQQCSEDTRIFGQKSITTSREESVDATPHA